MTDFMQSIIISGLPASGKTTVAEIIAKKLHIKAVNGSDILKEVAISMGYKISGENWWDTKEGLKFLNERKSNSRIDKETDRIFVKKIASERIVATSYTMPWLSPRGFKVWLSASTENRAKRMAKRDGTSISKALNIVKVRDVENYKIYKRLYGIEFGRDTSPFDLAIKTDKIRASKVADIIIAAVR
ncbi:MAG: cytidylate kinase family protein [Candidatus Micrarchaeaceae archaeon]